MLYPRAALEYSKGFVLYPMDKSLYSRVFVLCLKAALGHNFCLISDRNTRSFKKIPYIRKQQHLFSSKIAFSCRNFLKKKKKKHRNSGFPTKNNNNKKITFSLFFIYFLNRKFTSANRSRPFFILFHIFLKCGVITIIFIFEPLIICFYSKETHLIHELKNNHLINLFFFIKTALVYITISIH